MAMRCQASVLLALIGCLAGGQGGVTAQDLEYVYDCSYGAAFWSNYFSGLQVDDISLASGETYFDYADFTFNYRAGNPVIDLRIELDVYDGIDYAAQPMLTDHLSSFSIHFPQISPGTYQTYSVPIPRVIVPDGRFGVRVRFANNATGETVSAGMVFAGQPIPLGSSLDMYAEDKNQDGAFQISEAGGFGGPPQRANFHLLLAKRLDAGANLVGNVDLQQVSSPLGQSGTLDLRTPGTQSVVYTFPITLDLAGDYAVPNVPAGVYDIAVKFPNWLRQVTHGANVAGVTVASFSLTNGDSVPDNGVNLLDLNSTLVSFGGSAPDPSDMNWDGLVDLLDLNIVLLNFGSLGDP